MSTWTNIKIPQRFDVVKSQTQEITLLSFKLNQAQIEIKHLYNELENIFESLKQNKEITLSYDKETIKARLVE